MDKVPLEERLANSAGQFKRQAPYIVVFCVLLTGILLAQLVVSPPTFQTDLGDFAPESESSNAHDRIHENFPDETRPMFVHVTADDGSNVLSIASILAMNDDLKVFENASEMRQDIVSVWTTAPGILQLSLNEEGNGEDLGSMESWSQILDILFDEDETCGLTADDQLLSAATYASAALLHNDLTIDDACSYLDSGNGTATPFASSTLWVLEIDPELEEHQRRQLQSQMRDVFSEQSSTSSMNYLVISNDLLAHDIDAGTFDNLLLLIILASLVVILLLGIAFRSIKHVLFPLIGLSSALIWTYGILNVAGARFTALEATVAPLVLGLGIDYAIHLQRSQSSISEKYPDTAESWLRAVAELSVPLSLAVVTTVAAFLANIISPLPPLATLGYALALGVVCAFLSATIFVGALHVVFGSEVQNVRQPLTLPRVSERLVKLQQKQQVAVILAAVIISGLSVYGAASLETDFDLADFVDQEMEIMTVRDALGESYESAGWKVVYVLMEPVDGTEAIPADDILLNELRGFHSDLQSNNDVVGTDFRIPAPSYDGPYPLIRDAILRNATFGEEHNMEVFAGNVYLIEQRGGVDLGPFFAALASNQSVADPLTGETWSERLAQSVHLEATSILHLRHEIRVEATTSSESDRVVENFQETMGSTDESGTLTSTLSNHAQLHVTGDLVMLQTVLDGLTLSQIESTSISLIVSFLVLFLLTRRILPAIIILFPVGIASLWVVGSMALLGLKWNVLTVMVTALTLGIGIDYSIHMWRRFEVELEKRGSHWSALQAAMETTGVALMLSAVTTMAGFAVLLFSPMPVIQDFGLITAVTVLFSLLLALVLLPVLVELSARAEESSSLE